MLPKLKPGARIVSTASGAHRRAKLDFDDLQSRHGYSGFAVYSKSKLCNILFTRELARRIAGTGVTANCLHPGFVATRFGDQSGGLVSRCVSGWPSLSARISPEEGAKTIVYLASSPNVASVSGEYFYECKIDMPSPKRATIAMPEKLWDVSAEIAGVGLGKYRQAFFQFHFVFGQQPERGGIKLVLDFQHARGQHLRRSRRDAPARRPGRSPGPASSSGTTKCTEAPDCASPASITRSCTRVPL